MDSHVVRATARDEWSKRARRLRREERRGYMISGIEEIDLIERFAMMVLQGRDGIKGSGPVELTPPVHLALIAPRT